MTTRGDKCLALGLFGLCLLLGLLSGHTACAQDTTTANPIEQCINSTGIDIDLYKVREWFALRHSHSLFIPSCDCLLSLQAPGGRLHANLSVHISAPRSMWRCSISRETMSPSILPMRKCFSFPGSIRPWTPRWLRSMDRLRTTPSDIGTHPITRPTQSSRCSRQTTLTTLLSAATLMPTITPLPLAWFWQGIARSLPLTWTYWRATVRLSMQTSSTAAWALSHRMAREWQ